MKFACRTDASIKIGTGHVMRCLTLDEALKVNGSELQFICRAHEGSLCGLLGDKGFKVHELQINQKDYEFLTPNPRISVEDYVDWLGSTQDQDAQATLKILGNQCFDWLIVDHYGLDVSWEVQLRPVTQKLMVIDDLANRRHDCDLLLDQNYVYGDTDRYSELVPASCKKLIGQSYALLRKEFAKVRETIQERSGRVRRLFVYFGGSDLDNMTATALKVLSMPEFSDLDVDVAMGANNPRFREITVLVGERPRTTLHVQVDNIAELMVEADLALCAGGSSTWERLCVGLPSIVVTVAENQELLTRALNEDGFLRWLGSSRYVDEGDIAQAIRDSLQQGLQHREISRRGMELVDGNGSQRVSNLLNSENWN